MTQPAEQNQPETIVVEREPLRRVLQALHPNAPGHYIRELQVTRGPLFENPIDTLIQQFDAGGVKRDDPEMLPNAIFSTLVDAEGKVIGERCFSTMTPKETYEQMVNSAMLQLYDLPPDSTLASLIGRAADAAKLQALIQMVVENYELPRDVLAVLVDGIEGLPYA
jgi:hypothetical protein